MTEKLKARLEAILPTLRTLGQWLLLAGLAGTACGLAGAAFTWCVAQATALRGAHPWLLYCMPLWTMKLFGKIKIAGDVF